MRYKYPTDRLRDHKGAVNDGVGPSQPEMKSSGFKESSGQTGRSLQVSSANANYRESGVHIKIANKPEVRSADGQAEVNHQKVDLREKHRRVD